MKPSRLTEEQIIGADVSAKRPRTAARHPKRSSVCEFGALRCCTTRFR